MNSKIVFVLNGQSYYINQSIKLLDLLNYLNYNSGLLVLEYNSLICNKDSWGDIRIKNNSKIEIVTVVGGG